jgi:hypothetical protein
MTTLCGMKATKALDKDQVARVRDLAARLVRERHGGNVSAAARALGVSQAALNDLVTGNRGAGLRLATAIVDYAGVSLDEIIRGGRVPSPSGPREPSSGSTPTMSPLRSSIDAAQENRQGSVDRNHGGAVASTMPKVDLMTEARESSPGRPGWTWVAAKPLFESAVREHGFEASPMLLAHLATLAYVHMGSERRALFEQEAMRAAEQSLKAVSRTPIKAMGGERLIRDVDLISGRYVDLRDISSAIKRSIEQGEVVVAGSSDDTDPHDRDVARVWTVEHSGDDDADETVGVQHLLNDRAAVLVLAHLVRKVNPPDGSSGGR